MSTPSTSAFQRSGPTAVAIDHAIKRVLEERRRAKESGEACTDAAPTTGAFEADCRNAANESSTTEAQPRKASLISRSIHRVTQPFANTIKRATAIVGPAGTYERGFILSAGTIAAVLTVLRLAGETSPLYSIGISGLILAGTLAPCLQRGIEMQRGKRLQNSPAKSALACILCSPLFTYLAAPNALGRSTKAALWTSWVGMLGGTVALISTMI